MPLPPRLFPGDEELGKRDDNHRPGGRKNALGLAWQHRRIPVVHGPHRRNLKRVALGMLGIICIYYFFKNMPTDLERPRQRPDFSRPSSIGQPVKAPPQSSKSGKEADTKLLLHDFNGPIKFYELASTLHAASRTRGAELINPNVVSAILRCCRKYILRHYSYSPQQASKVLQSSCP